MKNVTWVILLALITYHVFCHENLLSKFHQNGFKIKDYRVELTNYNEKYYYFYELKTFKYNRTTPAVNATFKLKISVKDKLEGVVQAYKFLSNEYRHFPMRFQVNLNKAFHSNVIGLEGMKRCGNVTGFDFEKDVTYHYCNFVIDETQLPPLIPSGRFKYEIQVLYSNENVQLISIFFEIYTPIPYPRH